MWLDKAHSERFLWFSIVVVKNLKLDLSLGQFNVEQGKQHIFVVVTVTVAVIEGRPKHILRYVIITFMLFFLHVIDDIGNNIYVVFVLKL